MSKSSGEEWPEAIVRVQWLSEECVDSIPEKYIKPVSERPGEGENNNNEKMDIPMIDLGGEDEKKVGEQIWEACRDWGFFQVVNHGVSPLLMDKTRDTWRQFFHLPLELKQQYANTPKTYEGYGSRLGVEKNAILDWSDYYFLHYLPLSLKDYHKWPAHPDSCSQILDDYGTEVVKLSQRLMKVLSFNLGLTQECLGNAFGGEEAATACLRVNFYPKCPRPDLTLGLSSHSDPGGITLLLPDPNIPGLQVRRGNSWITVNPLPHAFIVNIGDQIQVSLIFFPSSFYSTLLFLYLSL